MVLVLVVGVQRRTEGGGDALLVTLQEARGREPHLLRGGRVPAERRDDDRRDLAAPEINLPERDRHPLRRLFVDEQLVEPDGEDDVVVGAVIGLLERVRLVLPRHDLRRGPEDPQHLLLRLPDVERPDALDRGEGLRGDVLLIRRAGNGGPDRDDRDGGGAWGASAPGERGDESCDEPQRRSVHRRRVPRRACVAAGTVSSRPTSDDPAPSAAALLPVIVALAAACKTRPPEQHAPPPPRRRLPPTRPPPPTRPRIGDRGRRRGHRRLRLPATATTPGPRPSSCGRGPGVPRPRRGGHRLPERDHGGARGLLRAALGLPQGPDAAGAGEPRSTGSTHLAPRAEL